MELNIDLFSILKLDHEKGDKEVEIKRVKTVDIAFSRKEELVVLFAFVLLWFLSLVTVLSLMIT